MKEIYVRELKIEDSKMRNCLKFLRNNRKNTPNITWKDNKKAEQH